MINLEQFGLGRKKKGYFPDRKNRKEQDNGIKRSSYVKAAIILIFLGLLISFFPGSSFRDFSYKTGEPWRADDLTAPFTFSLLKDREEMREAEQEARTNTPSIFYLDDEAIVYVENRLDNVFLTLSPLLDLYSDWYNAQLQNSEEVDRDSLRFTEALADASLPFDDVSLNALLENYIRSSTSGNRPSATRFIGIDIRAQVYSTIQELHQDGVIDIPKPELSIPEIMLRDQSNRTEQILNSTTLRDIPEARDFGQFRLNRTFSDNIATAAIELFEYSMVPNYIYNNEDTEAAVQEAIDAISPTKGAITAGQMIIRKGDLITPERLNMLQSLEAARANRASDLEIWQQHLGNAIIIIAIFLFFIMYLYLYRNPIFSNNAMLTLVLLAMAIVLTFAIFVIRIDGLSIYLVPMAIAPIILTIIFDSRVGLMTTTALALTIAFMSGNNFEYVVSAITASSIAVYSVRDIKNRSQFFLTTPALVFVSYVLILLGFTLIRPGGWDVFWSLMIFVVGNAIFIWLTYPLILLFEKLFKVT
ncbi:MAG: hypothetical protein LAT57_11545, partial [Balneolales bacterium]|nr:hypothetical protein [Balneolales bacterium]